MSDNPFAADTAVAERIAHLKATVGPAVEAAVAAYAGARGGTTANNHGSVVPAADAARLVKTHSLASTEELMLVALPSAQKLARPPISNFLVGCIGLEAGTGNLVLGGNLEFPGSHLGTTVHGEGFVFTRAFSRDTAITTLAIGPQPCAHCRQYMSEFAATRTLAFIDPLGHRLSIDDLYPWSFTPANLGDSGVVPGQEPQAEMELGPNTLPETVAARLLETGRRAHAPYSKSPGAVALTLADGSIVTGAAIESVAFNPTIAPMQAALIDLLAHGYAYNDIQSAALGTVEEGAVDYSRSTAELLAAVAPGVRLAVVNWRL